MTRYFVDIAGCYIGGFDGAEPPDGSIEVPTVPDDARQVWSGASWCTPLLTLDEARAAKLAALVAKRWSVETGGITIGGAHVRTDATSQAKITGAVSLFQNDPDLGSIDWEAQPGVWVTVDPVAMIAIGVAAGRHVQACFSRARALSALILAAGDEAKLAAIDIETDWPG